MSFIDYNQNIPGSQNNPSDDQPKMRTNTNSIRDWVIVDHFGFRDNNGGLHKQARIINQLNIPAGLTTTMGTIYTKLATSTGVLTESNIFFTPGTSGNEYQITRVITASFPLFSVLTQNYNLSGANFRGGWTFLPGGLLFQYGIWNRMASALTDVPVPFPVTFSSFVANVSLTSITQDNNQTLDVRVKNTSVSATGFNAFTPSNADFLGFYWTAIGK